MTAVFAWHVHHKALVELLTQPIEARQQYIQEHKPRREHEVRLRLLQPVRGKLPDAVTEAGEEYQEAVEAYKKEWEVAYPYQYGRRINRRRTWDAYQEALRDNAPAIEALHAQECPDCPWNGETIFPEEENID